MPLNAVVSKEAVRTKQKPAGTAAQRVRAAIGAAKAAGRGPNKPRTSSCRERVAASYKKKLLTSRVPPAALDATPLAVPGTSRAAQWPRPAGAASLGRLRGAAAAAGVGRNGFNDGRKKRRLELAQQLVGDAQLGAVGGGREGSTAVPRYSSSSSSSSRLSKRGVFMPKVQEATPKPEHIIYSCSKAYRGRGNGRGGSRQGSTDSIGSSSRRRSSSRGFGECKRRGGSRED